MKSADIYRLTYRSAQARTRNHDANALIIHNKNNKSKLIFIRTSHLAENMM